MATRRKLFALLFCIAALAYALPTALASAPATAGPDPTTTTAPSQLPYQAHHRICTTSRKPVTCDKRIDRADRRKRAAQKRRRRLERLVRRYNKMVDVGDASTFGGEGTACGGYIEYYGTAHKTLPCGTRVRLCTSPERCLVVTVMDRGPFIAGRAWDLSTAAMGYFGCDGVCKDIRSRVLR